GTTAAASTKGAAAGTARGPKVGGGRAAAAVEAPDRGRRWAQVRRAGFTEQEDVVAGPAVQALEIAEYDVVQIAETAAVDVERRVAIASLKHVNAARAPEQVYRHTHAAKPVADGRDGRRIRRRVQTDMNEQIGGGATGRIQHTQQVHVIGHVDEGVLERGQITQAQRAEAAQVSVVHEHGRPVGIGNVMDAVGVDMHDG